MRLKSEVLSEAGTGRASEPTTRCPEMGRPRETDAEPRRRDGVILSYDDRVCRRAAGFFGLFPGGITEINPHE